MGKFRGIVRAFPHIWEGRVLDIGCRSGNLKRALPGREWCYWGMDLCPPADVIGDLEAGLPFEQASFDMVIALDVLEHTDNIYQAFAELCRVARTYILITLPNAYELRHRLRFFLGQELSGKYGLPLDPPGDRHRWLFSLLEARAFTHALGQRHNFAVMGEGCLVGPRRGWIGGRFVVQLCPNLLSPVYLSLLERKKADPW
jgi:SAM-dependent methyltransferase